MRVEAAIAVSIVIIIVIAVLWWLASTWIKGNDTLQKQKVLAEQYGCTPVSVTASGFW
jgi:hypothetical protein